MREDRVLTMQGKLIYIGLDNGDSNPWFWESEADAVKFLKGDPSNKDMGAMAASRLVFSAVLGDVKKLKIVPPAAPKLVPDVVHPSGYLPGHGPNYR